MTRRDLPPAERAGILMHPYVLAAHTKESGVSPFPLGQFVYENILCNVIGLPSMTPVLQTKCGETWASPERPPRRSSNRQT